KSRRGEYMIRILFADDHEMVRIGVTAYLSAQPDMEVIAEATNGKEAVAKTIELKPDIILMDLVMDDMDGIEATKQIMKQWPKAKIIIVTSFIDDDIVYRALEAGWISYMLMTAKAKIREEAVRDSFNRMSRLEPEAAGRIVTNLREEQPLHEAL